jgi:hypothetical protein
MYIRWHECELYSGFTPYIIEHYRLSDTEILHTETNRGKKAIIVDGYVYRQTNTIQLQTFVEVNMSFYWPVK